MKTGAFLVAAGMLVGLCPAASPTNARDPAKTKAISTSQRAASERLFCDAEGTWDNGILDLVPDPRFDHSGIWTGTEMIVWGGYDWAYTFATGGRYDPLTDTWQRVSTVGAPSARADHTAVWTGSEMLVWGGAYRGAAGEGYTPLGDGGRYDPAVDAWNPISTAGAPEARVGHAAVWTGTEMIVWGGSGFGNGARYDPTNDVWTPMTMVGAPSAGSPLFVWTGTEMIVWGGSDGARYDPSTDTWTPISAIGAPPPGGSERLTVWTGQEMIVWRGGTAPPASPGGRYDPSTDTWRPMAAHDRSGFAVAVWTGTEMILGEGTAGPSPSLYDPTTDTWSLGADHPSRSIGVPSVWTGSLMVVWGGSDYSSAAARNLGWRYSPLEDSWTRTSDGPTPRGGSAIWAASSIVTWNESGESHRYDPILDTWSFVSAPIIGNAVWTGLEIVWWGGPSHGGGRYDPLTDTWVSIATGGPLSGTTALWTGSEVIFWSPFDGGGRYDPSSDLWRTMSSVGSPPSGVGVWTGREMLVFSSGGGARYDPGSDTWTPISTLGAPQVDKPAVVWSGHEMLVWGGGPVRVDTGARYDPDADAWAPISTIGAPSPRSSPGAIWTGSEMVIWGGDGESSVGLDTGARYDPGNDAWIPVSTLNRPVGREGHAMVWTGTMVIVLGGFDYIHNQTFLNSGGRYFLGDIRDDDADGHAECAGDCNDADPSISPAAVEVCNGIDDNCDGVIDEERCSFQLLFPLEALTPCTAAMSAVIDHSGTPLDPEYEGSCWYDRDGRVEAYDAEVGDTLASCGRKRIGYSNAGGTAFSLNGHYVGVGGCRPHQPAPIDPAAYLNFDGHSGYDFPAARGAAILAAEDGNLYEAAKDVINDCRGRTDPWAQFHDFYIDHGNGYSTWYLYADDLSDDVKSQIEQNGYATVTKGQLVAYAGSFGRTCHECTHLHFEVRHHEAGENPEDDGVVVDPYAPDSFLWADSDGDEIADGCDAALTSAR